ncbi:MAG: hypothetical protein MUO75_07115 [Actinobacteria bacterium]|nr:hypothetical protein [Actinomycetota bacterium]
MKEAGYSAHLAELGRSIQEDIIGRYEFGSALQPLQVRPLISLTHGRRT